MGGGDYKKTNSLYTTLVALSCLHFSWINFWIQPFSGADKPPVNTTQSNKISENLKKFLNLLILHR